jgi:hypothetical protein
MGFFALLEKVGCERPQEIMKGFEGLADKVHPLVLGNVSRLLEQTQLVALRLLGTRTEPFTEDKNRQIVRRLSSEIFSHRHTISRTEAINFLELEQIVKAEDAHIHDELWNMYCDYRELFDFENRFSPNEFLVAENLDENTWEGLPGACVESLERFDVFRYDVGVRRLRQVPPELKLNVGLNNLSLPAINIPELPEGITPQQIAQITEQLLQQLIPGLLQNAVSEAAREATQLVLNSLPTAGFEQITLNAGWRREVEQDDR